ncbi:nuclear transport factor 2 family protein [Branchiibius cervicis]|uniref:Nuclear transport factor 2 family protein n=1 Tax=Branchiibius cervicis TaxID=908252 RepID=A0ABW2ANI8_9MICO
MTTVSAKQFLQRWFAELSRTGFDAAVFLDVLSDDMVWTATGESPVSGVFRGKQAYIGGVYHPLDDHLVSWPRADVVRIIGDGEWAAVQFRGSGGQGRNGTDYSLDYCWLIHVTGEQISEVIGFYDQTKVHELFS